MYEWVKGNAYQLNVTLYDSNITLNSYAASYFTDIRWVMIGIDSENKKVAIKAVPKKEIDLHLISLDQLHKRSIGKGYGRISNQSVMNEIRELLKTDINGVKFQATYNEKEMLLEINLQNKL